MQATLVDALQAWRVQAPVNPSAWVHRIAKNKILDALSPRGDLATCLLAKWPPTWQGYHQDLDELFLDTEIEDSQLRMIFACCHPQLSLENQLALTLKALCGFGNSEIARALLISEETVKKRLQRATRSLIDQGITLDPPKADELGQRLDSVHQALYLLFNEGYSSCEGGNRHSGPTNVRRRLGSVTCSASDPRCSTPTTHALMAVDAVSRRTARRATRPGRCRSCSWRNRTEVNGTSS